MRGGGVKVGIKVQQDEVKVHQCGCWLRCSKGVWLLCRERSKCSRGGVTKCSKEGGGGGSHCYAM